MKLTAYTDGGSRSNPGPAGYGLIITDSSSGDTLATRAGWLGNTTNNVAEYTAVVETLRLVRELETAGLSIEAIEIRADSKLVVEQMSGRWKIKHGDMRRLAADARTAFDPGRVTYSWIPRAHNTVADALANKAMDQRSDHATDEWQTSLTDDVVGDQLSADKQHTEPNPEPDRLF